MTGSKHGGRRASNSSDLGPAEPCLLDYLRTHAEVVSDLAQADVAAPRHLSSYFGRLPNGVCSSARARRRNSSASSLSPLRSSSSATTRSRAKSRALPSSAIDLLPACGLLPSGNIALRGFARLGQPSTAFFAGMLIIVPHKVLTHSFPISRVWRKVSAKLTGVDGPHSEGEVTENQLGEGYVGSRKRHLKANEDSTSAPAESRGRYSAVALVVFHGRPGTRRIPV